MLTESHSSILYALLRTAFGVWMSFADCNSIILEVAAGAIQDRSGGSYNNVIYLLIAIKVVQVCLGPVYDLLDGKWIGHALRKPERKRLELRLADNSADSIDHLPATSSGEDIPVDTDHGLKGWRPSKLVCGVVGAELACAILVAWVVYIVIR